MSASAASRVLHLCREVKRGLTTRYVADELRIPVIEASSQMFKLCEAQIIAPSRALPSTPKGGRRAWVYDLVEAS